MEAALTQPERLKVRPETSLAMPFRNILKLPKIVWRRPETDSTTESQTEWRRITM
jgi:hypothetical protein